ncbi:hypothetical protein [Paenibacillus alvei]|uniref:hypothetical protein n=1 Tax=Paenibacillus alvei TaxID=44250 RepID=UPI0013DC1349|nr:hypothetical protein [Paenibacillus alvei]NEZ43493.1 hypothetical protein [Paenibacillus alvei]
MNQTENSYYRCSAFVGGDAVITTNDEVEYDRLMSAGGTLICHPNLFNPERDVEIQLLRSGAVPYVIRIPRDNLAAIRQIPTDRYESYVTQLYHCSHK